MREIFTHVSQCNISTVLQKCLHDFDMISFRSHVKWSGLAIPVSTIYINISKYEFLHFTLITCQYIYNCFQTALQRDKEIKRKRATNLKTRDEAYAPPTRLG